MKSPSGLLTTKHLAGTAPLPKCCVFLSHHPGPSQRWGCDVSSQPPLHTSVLCLPSSPCLPSGHFHPLLSCPASKPLRSELCPPPPGSKPQWHELSQIFFQWEEGCEGYVPHFFLNAFLSWKDLFSYFCQNGSAFSQFFFFIPGIQFLSMMRNEVKELAL